MIQKISSQENQGTLFVHNEAHVISYSALVCHSLRCVKSSCADQLSDYRFVKKVKDTLKLVYRIPKFSFSQNPCVEPIFFL